MNVKQALLGLEFELKLQNKKKEGRGLVEWKEGGSTRLAAYACFDSLSKVFQVEVNGKLSDLSGGYVRKENLHIYAEKLGIKKDTIRKRLAEFTKWGWAEKRKTGWQLISWKKVAALYEVEGLKKRYVKGATKAERRTSQAEIAITAKRRQKASAAYKKYLKDNNLKEESKTLRNCRKRDLYLNQKFSLSVREVGANIGLKNLKSIAKQYRKLVDKGVMFVQKYSLQLCHWKHYTYFQMLYKDRKDVDISSYAFLVDGIVHLRHKSNLILNDDWCLA